jgi:hypothetical protein
MNFGIGERVVSQTQVSGQTMLVVDINPYGACTPYPCVTVAWRENGGKGKAREAVIETKYLCRSLSFK